MWGDLDKNQIDGFLKSELIGRLGCFDGNKMYVVPITYAYNNGYIYGHTKDGLKIHMMRNNPNVCFEIDWMRDMSSWKSVILYGTFEELKGNDANNGTVKHPFRNINKATTQKDYLRGFGYQGGGARGRHGAVGAIPAAALRPHLRAVAHPAQGRQQRPDAVRPFAHVPSALLM